MIGSALAGVLEGAIKSLQKAVFTGKGDHEKVTGMLHEYAGKMLDSVEEAQQQEEEAPPPLHASTIISTDPVGYLLGLVLGSAATGLAVHAAARARAGAPRMDLELGDMDAASPSRARGSHGDYVSVVNLTH